MVRATPLYHGVALVRDLTLGVASYADLVHVGCVLALGLVGLVVTGAQLERLLLR